MSAGADPKKAAKEHLVRAKATQLSYCLASSTTQSLLKSIRHDTTWSWANNGVNSKALLAKNKMEEKVSNFARDFFVAGDIGQLRSLHGDKVWEYPLFCC